jgi:hypothetical protein
LVVGFFASIIVLDHRQPLWRVSGFFGGKVDMIMMRIVDVIYSFRISSHHFDLGRFAISLRDSLDRDFLRPVGPA